MNQLNKPIVSVIMSCFNSENFIDDAVNSITNQSFRDFEFLIMDDGSSDNTHKIIQNASRVI